MATCVYCICRSEAQAVRIANRLYNSGFSANDISMLHPDKSGTRDIGHTNSTKAPEGAAAGAGATSVAVAAPADAGSPVLR